MTDTPLHPIVIAAIVSGPFECLGDGSFHDGVEREQPNTLKDLLVPTKTSKRTPIEDRERPKKWWKAQCLHYGIQVPASAPISTYRVHLENAIRQRGGLKRPQELADLEFEQNAKFRRLNADVREATSGSSQTKPSKSKTKAAKPTQATISEPEPAPTKAKAKATTGPKAKAEPKPKAPKAKSEPKAKAEPKSKVEKESKTKARGSAAEHAPKATTTKKRKAETVVHVYHYDGDKATQTATTSVVEQETTKRPAKKARMASSPAPIPSRSQMPASDPPPSYSQTMFDQSATGYAIRRGVPGMFSGTYELECTSQENWPSFERPTLQVFMSKTSRPWFRALLTLPDFLTCLLHPKPNMHWAEDGYIRFEWCGREEGEGEIQPPGADNVGWLKMHKAEGRVKGMIQTPFGEFLFQGPRVGTDPPTIEYEWEDFSWDAYHDANQARW